MHRSVYAAAVAALLVPGLAQAGPAVGVDLSGGYPLGEGFTKDIGYGARLRVGYKLPIPIVKLTPEIGFGYDKFPGDGGTLIGGFVGARVTVGTPIAPGLYAHVGYAKLNVEPSLSVLSSDTGTTLDGGILIDFTAAPIVDVGVHAGYERLNMETSTGWLVFGVHASMAM